MSTWGGGDVATYEHGIDAQSGNHWIRIANDRGTADSSDQIELWSAEACPFCAGIRAAAERVETIEWHPAPPRSPNSVRDMLAAEIRRLTEDA